MQKAFYTEEKRMTIYALVNRVEGPYVYVGKTSSPRISAVYSHHRCGDIAATSGYCDLPEEVPELYILERIWATGAVAYRHTLAWLRYFLDEGYYAVNHEGTELQARTLQAETEEIYMEIRKKPLKTILNQTYIARPADANLPPEKKPQFFRQEEKTVQMNVRINRSDNYALQAASPLYDYKFFCFDGEPKYVYIDTWKHGDHFIDMCDMELNVIPGVRMGYDCDDSGSFSKPENYDKMVEYARKLSKPFRHVRVDMYNCGGKIYFGELSFSKGAGFDRIEPYEFDVELGSHWHIPK